MQQSEQRCHIHWRTTPTTAAQLSAWRWLWARLLGDGPAPQKERPQDRDPGAITTTAVNGRYIVSEQDNDSIHCALST